MKNVIKFIKYSFEATIISLLINKHLFTIKYLDNTIESKGLCLISRLGLTDLIEEKEKYAVIVRNPYSHDYLYTNLIGFPYDWVSSDSNNMYHRNPSANVWVESMNKNNKIDSNTWGSIPSSLIIGKCILTITFFKGNLRFLTNNKIREIYIKYYDRPDKILKY